MTPEQPENQQQTPRQEAAAAAGGPETTRPSSDIAPESIGTLRREPSQNQETPPSGNTMVVEQGQNSEVVIYQEAGGLVTLHQHERQSSIAVVIITIIIIALNVLLSIHVVQARANTKNKVTQALQKSSPGYKQNQSKSRFGPTLESRPDGTLDMSRVVSNSDAVANQDLTIKLNQQVNFFDGTSFIITAIKDWTPTKKINTAKPGQHYIKVYMTVGNRTEEPRTPLFMFNLVENGTITHDVVYSPLAEPEGALIDFWGSGTVLQPREAANGYVLVSVPIGHKPMLEIYKSGVTTDLKGALMKASIQL